MSRIILFTEDRIETDFNGVSYTQERRLQGDSWRSLVGGLPASVLAVRSLRCESPVGQELAEPIIELPYYQGIAGALRKMPALIAAIWREIGISSVVVAKLPGVVGSVAVTIAAVRRRPIAVHLVGDIEEVLLGTDSSLIRKAVARLSRLVTRHLVRKAKVVRYVTRQVLQVRYPPAKRSIGIFYTDANVTAMPTVNLSFRAGHILAIGSQDRPYKGHHILLHSFAGLRSRLPSTHLTIVGRGRHRRDLEMLAEELEIGDAVTFIEHIDSYEELSKVIQSCEVFVMPSLTEGLPRALVEAMSLGVACIGSGVGGIVELLSPDALVEPGDSIMLANRIEEVLTDETFRTRLQESALRDVRPYTEASLRDAKIRWAASLGELQNEPQ